jgi:hypothetical protein
MNFADLTIMAKISQAVNRVVNEEVDHRLKAVMPKEWSDVLEPLDAARKLAVEQRDQVAKAYTDSIQKLSTAETHLQVAESRLKLIEQENFKLRHLEGMVRARHSHSNGAAPCDICDALVFLERGNLASVSSKGNPHEPTQQNLF